MSFNTIITCNVCGTHYDNIDANRPIEIYAISMMHLMDKDNRHKIDLLNPIFPDKQKSYNDFHICTHCLKGLRKAEFHSRL